MKQLLPTITKLCKDVITKHFKETDIIENHIQTDHQDKKDFEQFRSRNTRYLSQKLDERKDIYNQYVRTIKFSEVYTRIIKNNAECPDKSEIYVPRKFRKDDYYVMSKTELDAISRFEQERLKSERDILTLRSQEYLSRMEKIDADITNFIKSKNLSSSVHVLAINRWEQCVSQDSNKVDTEWYKKMNSTKEAFARDKEYYKKHQATRVKTSKYDTDSHQKTSHDLNNQQRNDPQNSTSISNTNSTTMRSTTSKNDDQSKNSDSQSQRMDLRSSQRSLISQNNI